MLPSSLSSVLLSLIFLLVAQVAQAESFHGSQRRTVSRRHRSLSLKQRAFPAIGGWAASGCTSDQESPRALTGYSQDLGAQATIQQGLLICQKKGFKYASLQYGSQLYCGGSSNSLGSALSADRCSSPCQGQYIVPSSMHIQSLTSS